MLIAFAIKGRLLFLWELHIVLLRWGCLVFISKRRPLRFIGFWFVIFNDIVLIRHLLFLRARLIGRILRIILIISSQINKIIVLFGFLRDSRIAVVVFGCLFLDDWCMRVAVQGLSVLLHQFEKILLKVDKSGWPIQHYSKNVFHFRRGIERIYQLQ
jgi:hypothetical protein